MSLPAPKEQRTQHELRPALHCPPLCPRACCRGARPADHGVLRRAGPGCSAQRAQPRRRLPPLRLVSAPAASCCLRLSVRVRGESGGGAAGGWPSWVAGGPAGEGRAAGGGLGIGGGSGEAAHSLQHYYSRLALPPALAPLRRPPLGFRGPRARPDQVRTAAAGQRAERRKTHPPAQPESERREGPVKRPETAGGLCQGGPNRRKQWERHRRAEEGRRGACPLRCAVLAPWRPASSPAPCLHWAWAVAGWVGRVWRASASAAQGAAGGRGRRGSARGPVAVGGRKARPP